MESVKCLKGVIKAMSGLNFTASKIPDEVSFHLRFVPSKKFHIMTKYRSVAKCQNLDLSFTLGPVRKEELLTNQLRIKMYGRRNQRLSRSSCFGECAYQLEEVIDENIAVEIEEDVHVNVSKPTYSSDSDVLN